MENYVSRPKFSEFVKLKKVWTFLLLSKCTQRSERNDLILFWKEKNGNFVDPLVKICRRLWRRRDPSHTHTQTHTDTCTHTHARTLSKFLYAIFFLHICLSKHCKYFVKTNFEVSATDFYKLNLVRPMSHTIFWHTQYCDENILL